MSEPKPPPAELYDDYLLPSTRARLEEAITDIVAQARTDPRQRSRERIVELVNDAMLAAIAHYSAMLVNQRAKEKAR